MAVLEMRKLSVVGMNAKRTSFIHELMHLGVVELNSQESFMSDEEWAPDIFRTSNSADTSRVEADIARVSLALEMINKHDPAKKPLFGGRKVVERDEFNNRLDSMKTDIEINVDKAVMAHKEIMDGQNEINGLNSMIIGLTPWEQFDIPLHMRETEYAKVVVGSMNITADFNQALMLMASEMPSASVQKISQDEQQQYISIICFKEDQELVYETLRAFAFNPIQLPDYKGTAVEAIANCKKKITRIVESITVNEAVLASLAPSKEQIEFLYDSLIMSRDRAKIVGNMLSTETVFYFDGWVPLAAQKKVEVLLKEYEFYYQFEMPDKEEEIPVVLENDEFTTPFEAVTNMYSLPTRADIDPTKIFAPFYFIFFGMMLSDAAYGIILASACGIILKKYPLEGLMQRMVKMFFYCGISTFIWGVLFGGWFGNFFTVFADTIFGIDFVIPALWFEPLADPMTLLVFSLILGGIHLFTGMAVQAHILIKSGRTMDAVCDIFLWYLLLIGLVMFGLGGGLAGLGQVMAVVGAVGILVTGGRHKEGFGKVIGGIGSLYNITGYLSDLLSYSRLLALGLATGVVAQVINTLGSLAGGGFFGAIVLLFALVFGTIFNMAINVLGAFVHSARLQYVELFGKFYTGGGKAFAPFERKTKYFRILKEDESNG